MSVPRYAASLTLLFGEVAFLERFGVAPRAGFDAVEFVSPYEHEPAALARLRENLRFAAGALSAEGLDLLVGGINGPDMPGCFLQTSRQAFDLMDEVGDRSPRCQYDVHHMRIVEGDLAPTPERRLPRIGHVQVAAPPGRHEPGPGEINYRFLLPRLDRVGCRDRVGCEYQPAAGTVEGLRWREEVA